MKLKISDTLSFPESFVTQTNAILAKKGSGKSYTADVLAEEMLKADCQIVIIDVTGAHYGLRSSASGKRKGYPILIAGGDHGDILLEKTAGELMATAIVNEGFSCILDISLFRKNEAHVFLQDFLLNIYRLNRSPIHLFCDEADFYAPQKPFGNEAVTLGAMDDIVRRGRSRGIGCTIITQRPAVINKNVLTQCEILTTLRLVHPKDINAIKEWVDVHGDPEIANQMIKDLPSLPIGTAYVWAPGWPDKDGIFEKVKIRERETYDSGRTPQAGEKRSSPKVLAEIDIRSLGKRIQDTVAEVAERDPRFLREKIRKLEAEVKKKEVVKIKTEVIENPVLTIKDKEMLKKACSALEKIIKKIDDTAPIVSYPQGIKIQHTPNLTNTATAHPKHLDIAQKAVTYSARKNDTEKLGKGEKEVLVAVTQNGDMGCSREQITILTGYKRSTRDAYVQRLQQKDLVALISGQVCPTSHAYRFLGSDYKPLPTGDALREYWLKELPKGEREVLSYTSTRFPKPVSREEISEATGFKRSTRDAYIQRLSIRKLIQATQGNVVASEMLFD